MKMKAEGLDASVLDLDPLQPMPATSSTVKQTAAPSKPKKANPVPRVAMRPIFWSRLKDEEREATVWRNLSDESVDLDLAALELEFAKVKLKSGEEEAVEKEKAEKAEVLASSKPKEINLVDGKVSQNVGIVLVKLKMTCTEIFTAVVRCDEETLDAGKTELLLKSAPTADDMAAVADFSGDEATLGKVEKFFKAIAPIPDFAARLECFVFKQKLDQATSSLDERLKLITTACERVSRSERLAQVMEVVLRLGNYLNGGTSRGGCYGFKLETLAKLATVKSLDNKRTLMNWLAHWCERRDEQSSSNDPATTLVNFAEDFGEIDAAARCSLPAWSADLLQLEKKLELVQRQLALRASHPCSVEDRFVAAMGPFAQQGAKEIAALKRRQAATERRFAELVASFGEDPKVCGVEDFFKTLLGDFVRQFDKARQQNDKSRQMEEKAAQKLAAFEKKAALKAQGASADGHVTDVFATLKAEAADDILAKLQGPRRSRRSTPQRLPTGGLSRVGDSRDLSG